MIFIIKKPDGELRIYVDYRALNILTIKNRNTLSFIRDILTKLCYTKIYTKFNIIVVFNIIKMREENKEKIAFIIRYKLYEYTIIFFDLYNVFETFQVFINDILKKYFNDFYIAYLNNILIFNDNEKKHEIYVKKMLNKLRKTDVYLNIKKCEFKIKKVKYLKFIITTKNIEINFLKIDAIRN